MAIFSRIVRLWKADFHGVMDQLEDKELLLKQYLREMHSALQQKESKLERIEQTIRQSCRDLSHHQEEIEKLEKDLDLAVNKEKDDIARMLIRKRYVHQQGVKYLKRQLQIIEEEKQKLSDLLEQQRLQYDQLKVKAAAFNHQIEQQHFEGAENVGGESAGFAAPTEEEIELELLQRKVAVRQGGA